jgi:dolichyl-phosphate beta-glucosyltransferase
VDPPSSPDAPRTVIVVPCYNEAARLDVARFAEYAALPGAASLLFVDDGSTDDTAKVLSGLVRRVPGRIRALRLATNQGKSGAVRAGVLAALADGAVFVGFWDADLATPLAAIPRFLAALEGRPILLGAIGARVRLLGTTIERSAVRHYLGRVFATAASLVLGLGVYDTQCGAKLFRAGPLLGAAFAAPFRSRWAFDVELLARLEEAGRRAGALPVQQTVIELALEEWRDVRGSKLHPLGMVGAGLDLAFIRRHVRQDVGHPAAPPTATWLSGAEA